MAVSRATTPARSGSPVRATTPGRTTALGAMIEETKPTSRDVMANESRPRLLGGMKPIFSPSQKGKPKSQSTRKTRSDTKSLPGKPERLIEEVVPSTPKKTAKKKTAPNKAAAKKAVTPKVMKPTAAKVTKKVSPAKSKAKTATAKKTAWNGVRLILSKGKRRPRMAEERLPSAIGYDGPSELNEADKGGDVDKAKKGVDDMRKTFYLDGDDTSKADKGRGQGTNARRPPRRRSSLKRNQKNPYSPTKSGAKSPRQPRGRPSISSKKNPKTNNPNGAHPSPQAAKNPSLPIYYDENEGRYMPTTGEVRTGTTTSAAKGKATPKGKKDKTAGKEAEAKVKAKTGAGVKKATAKTAKSKATPEKKKLAAKKK